MMVAGEDSGDRHAASLVKSLKNRLPGQKIEFFGAAGKEMREASVEPTVDSDDFGIFGVGETIKALPMFLGVMKRLEDLAIERKPDLVILVDFPEFNLKLAKRLKKKRFKIVYYISPQLWAWRGYRVRGVRKYVDLLLATLPFEKGWYEDRGVSHVRYVGNPLAGKVAHKLEPAEFRRQHGIGPDRKLIAFLPGSRASEIERNFPVMLAAARLLNAERDDLRFCVGLAPSRSELAVARIIESDSGGTGSVLVVKDQTYDLLNAADAAVVASGTATLEAAIIGTPQVIVYRSTALNYVLMRPLVSVSNFGLANLIAGKTVFRELIQYQFSPQAVAEELRRLLEPGVNAELRSEASLIREKIGTANAADRAAEEIAKFAGF